MSTNPQQVTETVTQTADQPKNDKDYNFAQMRKQLEQERQGRLKAEEEAAALKTRASQTGSASHDDDDSYDEPYIDKHYFKKNLEKNMLQIKEEARREAQAEMQRLLVEEKKNAWLKSNPDFQEVMQHAQKFADRDPELAETILEMPEGFERQKLVYKNIKALGLHKPEQKAENIQDKIEKNRRSAFYQPSQMGSAPYGNSGDFSPAGQKNAFDQMRALQKRLRLN